MAALNAPKSSRRKLIQTPDSYDDVIDMVLTWPAVPPAARHHSNKDALAAGVDRRLAGWKRQLVEWAGAQMFSYRNSYFYAKC
jgi:hypothetical protein